MQSGPGGGAIINFLISNILILIGIFFKFFFLSLSPRLKRERERERGGALVVGIGGPAGHCMRALEWSASLQYAC